MPIDIRDRWAFHTNDGIMAISDIHGMYHKAKQAVDYALDNNLYIVFLGDLVDGGDMPFETVELVHSLVETGKAAFVIGNHDYKWYRAIKGNTPTRTTETMLSTLCDVPEGLEEQFMDMYVSIYENEMSHTHISCGTWIFSHAAIPPEFFYDGTMSRSVRERFMYGYASKYCDDSGFPTRTYEWIDQVPEGTSVVVGHDSVPMGKAYDGKPEVVVGAQKGRVYFTDTGCGKRNDGSLTSLVLKFSDDGLAFENFITQ